GESLTTPVEGPGHGDPWWAASAVAFALSCPPAPASAASRPLSELDPDPEAPDPLEPDVSDPEWSDCGVPLPDPAESDLPERSSAPLVSWVPVRRLAESS